MMMKEAQCVMGAVVRSCSVGGLQLTDASYSRFHWLPPHKHDRPSLVAVVRGSYVDRIDRKEETLVPGVVLARNSGVMHSGMIGGVGASCLLVEHLRGAFDLPSGLFGDGIGHRIVRDPALTLVVSRLWSEVWDKSPECLLILEGLAKQLIGLVARGSKVRPLHPPFWLEHAHSRIHEETASAPSVFALATEAQVHPSYFVRAFHRVYGIAPGVMMRQVRVGRAAGLLLSTAMSISEVAQVTGFVDRSHFGRVFKQLTGITPTQFRLVNRGSRSSARP